MSGVRAIVFPAKGQVAVWDDLVLPALGPNDVELRTTRSGITAGTEKNLLLGGNYSPGYPAMPGYQQVGRIARVGADVTRFRVGQRAYAHFWGHAFGGPAVKGIGAHAAARVGPTDSAIIPLPDALPDDEAALLSVASIGLHAAQRAGVGLGQRVLVVGLGIIGQFAAQAVRALGGRAFGLDQAPLRLERAGQLACEATFDGRAPDLWQRLAAAGPFDVMIETTGLNSFVQEMLERRLLAPRSAMVLVGGRFAVEYGFNVAQRLEVSILHTTHHTDADTAEVIRLRLAGLWQIAPLITHRFRPDQAAQAWQVILGEGLEWLGIIYDWAAPAVV